MQLKEIAKGLRFGQKRKVEHCGTDRTAYLSNSARGVSLYCFRCGASEFEPHGKLSGADFITMRAADDRAASQPYPKTMGLTEAPGEAHLWVLSAGITPERAEEVYGFGYSERTCRVVCPIMHDLRSTGHWTARSTDGRKPKYIMGRGSAEQAWTYLRGMEVVVVVEDILSAIRVHEAGYGVCAILGTSTSAVKSRLLADRKVCAWFDGDLAGRKGYLSLKRSLSPYGVVPSRILTTQDPKCYSKTEIQKLVEAAVD